jgi:hypothetical protein
MFQVLQVYSNQSVLKKRALRMVQKVEKSGKELLMTFIALLIALLFSALTLGIANWEVSVFGITGDTPKAAAIIAVAIIIGPTIAAFATKKYF